MTRGTNQIPGSDSAGRLCVLCWCGQNIVWIPAKLVREGVTGVCGRAACRALARAADDARGAA